MERDDVLEYLLEARETLENIEKDLLHFEKSTLDGSLVDRDLLDTLFRHFHTIKGSSGFFGLTAIVKIAHSAENLLDYLRKNPEDQDEDTLELLITALDYLNELVEHEESSPSGGDFFSEEQIQFLNKLNQKNEFIRVHRLNTPEEPTTTQVSVEFGLFGDDPKTAEPKEEFGLFTNTPKAADTTEFGLFNNASIPKTNEEFGLFHKLDVISEKEKIQKPEENLKNEKKTIIKKDIRIDTDKLDSLLDIVGEIVITEPMVTDHQDISKLKLENFHKTALQLKKLIRNLQEITLSLRMVPIAGIFSRMERLVRDTD